MSWDGLVVGSVNVTGTQLYVTIAEGPNKKQLTSVIIIPVIFCFFSSSLSVSLSNSVTIELGKTPTTSSLGILSNYGQMRWRGRAVCSDYSHDQTTYLTMSLVYCRWSGHCGSPFRRIVTLLARMPMASLQVTWPLRTSWSWRLVRRESHSLNDYALYWRRVFARLAIYFPRTPHPEYVANLKRNQETQTERHLPFHRNLLRRRQSTRTSIRVGVPLQRWPALGSYQVARLGWNIQIATYPTTRRWSMRSWSAESVDTHTQKRRTVSRLPVLPVCCIIISTKFKFESKVKKHTISCRYL